MTSLPDLCAYFMFVHPNDIFERFLVLTVVFLYVCSIVFVYVVEVPIHSL